MALQGGCTSDVDQGRSRLSSFRIDIMILSSQNLIPGELVNGSVGQVVRFCTPTEALKEHTEIAKVEGTGGVMPPKDLIWPVVRFIGGREMMCIPQEFTINNPNGGMEARREQVCPMSYVDLAPMLIVIVTPNFGLGPQRS
jgi:hypothetical protein